MLFEVLGKSLYCLVAFMVATPYFNYQYARQHGFTEWLFFGEIVPTAKSVVWPYFAYSDFITSRNEDISRQKLMDYWKIYTGLISELDTTRIDVDNETGHFEETMKNDPLGALNALSTSLTKSADKRGAILMKLENLTPPPILEDLRNSDISYLKGEIPLIRDVVSAIQSKDKYAFLEKLRCLKDFSAEWIAKRNVERAKFNAKMKEAGM